MTCQELGASGAAAAGGPILDHRQQTVEPSAQLLQALRSRQAVIRCAYLQMHLAYVAALFNALLAPNPQLGSHDVWPPMAQHAL